MAMIKQHVDHGQGRDKIRKVLRVGLGGIFVNQQPHSPRGKGLCVKVGAAKWSGNVGRGSQRGADIQDQFAFGAGHAQGGGTHAWHVQPQGFTQVARDWHHGLHESAVGWRDQVVQCLAVCGVM